MSWMNLTHAVLPAVYVLYSAYRYGWDEKAVGLALAGFEKSSRNNTHDAAAAAVQPELSRTMQVQYGNQNTSTQVAGVSELMALSGR